MLEPGNMPDRRAHRGPHPEDAQLFGAPAVPALRAAAADLAWLLDRGYASTSALKLVGDRHGLTRRQREAVRRVTCTAEEARSRGARRLSPAALHGASLRIDGFNLLTSIEAALGGGVLLVGRDRCLRDMASMHGSYRKVEETGPALDAIAATLDTLGVATAHWHLDRPVSNSGRLRGAILAHAASRAWTVTLDDDPDALLARSAEPVATADSGVLDRCAAFADLAGEVVARHVAHAWIVDLAPAPREHRQTGGGGPCTS